MEFSRFKELSHQYKEDQIDSSTYLANCNALLSNDVGKLESFMADLIVLLPQIRKQQVGHLLFNILSSFLTDLFHFAAIIQRFCSKISRIEGLVFPAKL